MIGFHFALIRFDFALIVFDFKNGNHFPYLTRKEFEITKKLEIPDTVHNVKKIWDLDFFIILNSFLVK